MSVNCQGKKGYWEVKPNADFHKLQINSACLTCAAGSCAVVYRGMWEGSVVTLTDA